MYVLSIHALDQIFTHSGTHSLLTLHRSHYQIPDEKIYRETDRDLETKLNFSKRGCSNYVAFLYQVRNSMQSVTRLKLVSANYL